MVRDVHGRSRAWGRDLGQCGRRRAARYLAQSAYDLIGDPLFGFPAIPPTPVFTTPNLIVSGRCPTDCPTQKQSRWVLCAIDRLPCGLRPGACAVPAQVGGVGRPPGVSRKAAPRPVYINAVIGRS